MTCQEIAEFLMDYLNGDLSEREHAIFEKHLGICPECVNYVRSYEITIHATRSACDLVHDRHANQVPDDLIRAILAARNEQ